MKDLKAIKVREVMARGVLIIPENASVAQAVRIIVDNKVSGLAVTSSQEGLVGVVSDTDIMKVFGEDLTKIKVKDVMTHKPITINKEQTLGEACQIMREKKIHRLLIQEEVKGVYGKEGETKYFPAGLLSTTDIVKVLAENL
ncbi:MAG: CBS domain-containing protein [bacterium]|nr:CBS domain-containing protein [bacterium]